MNDFYFTVTGSLTLKVQAKNEDEATDKASDYLVDNSPLNDWEITPTDKQFVDYVDLEVQE